MGERVKDLYEVCGQAQRCVYWKAKPEALVDHMRRRNGLRLNRTGVDRLERGDTRRLLEISKAAPYLNAKFRAFIVQPGLSKVNATDDQLTLLGATQLFLSETYNLKLEVIGSP